MEITPQSKLLDVLEAYPALESQIVEIAPPFKNLKNPVLRRTVGKIATIAQVAQIGGMDVNHLVNTLRKAAGQGEWTAQAETPLVVHLSRAESDPEWISGEPQFTINGTALLGRGEVPLAKVNEFLRKLDSGRFLLLVTNFEPSPILEAMEKQGRKVFQKAEAGQHLTFIG
jgi:hypothetical protein